MDASRPILAALAALLAAALAGCVGDQDKASSVHDLRILAIAADPPDFVVPSGYDPSSGPPAIPDFRLKVLLGDSPAEGRTLRWRITACSQPDTLRCEGVDAGVGVSMLIGEGQGVATDGLLEVGAELGGPQQLAQLAPLLEDAVANDAYYGFGGLPLVVSVRVWVDGAEEVFGGKRIPIWLPIPKDYEEIVANQLPPEPEILFGGVVALPGDSPQISGTWQSLDVFPTDPALRETYYVPNFDGEVEKLHEAWSYSWYTTKGSFATETTGGWNPLTDEEGKTETRLEIPEGAEPGPFKVLCVVRDGRGGESWTVRDAEYLGP